MNAANNFFKSRLNKKFFYWEKCGRAVDFLFGREQRVSKL